MNVFVLCTGRCGSRTFYEACRHITNYTTGHESRITYIGDERLDYPENHIEADNRLSWFLGRLDQKYGDGAFYVHMTRDREETAQSYAKRHDTGIIRAYRDGILFECPAYITPLDVCRDYCDTVNTNIQSFLKDKTRQMDFRMESAKEDFRIFWERIGAEGDLEAALAEWDVAHNASGVPHPEIELTWIEKLALKKRRLMYLMKNLF